MNHWMWPVGRQHNRQPSRSVENVVHGAEDGAKVIHVVAVKKIAKPAS